MKSKEELKILEYKKGCGFRFKLNRCHFKEIDCNSKTCSMYGVEWNKDSLIRKIDDEKDNIERLSEMIDNTDDKDKIKKLELLRQDTGIGLAFLIEALFFIKKGYYMEYKKIKSSFGLGFLNK